MKMMQKIQRILAAVLVGIMCISGVHGIAPNIKSVAASDNDVVTIHDGASVRLVEGSSGIRFCGEVDKDYVADLEATDNVSDVTYGIIITPKSYLNDDCSDFTVLELEAKYASNPYLKIEAEKKIDNGDTYEFRCAMIGLKRNVYAWEFAARSYIEVVYDDGTTNYIYSDFDDSVNARSIRYVAKAALADSSASYTDMEETILVDYTGEVYLSSTDGNDANAGSENAPFATLSKALDAVPSDGTIVVCDDYTVPSDFEWEEENNIITIIGDDDDDDENLTFTNISDNVVIGDNVTFDNITLTFTNSTNVFANGHTLVIGENVTMTNPINLYGGGNQTTVASTNITVKAGNYYKIFGGSYAGTVEGDTTVYIGGTTNAAANPASHSGTYNIYGGGYDDTVKGNTYLTFTGEAQANYVYGGSYGTGIVTGTNVIFAGGKAMSLCGGNYASSGISSTKVQVTGGEMEQLFGANQGASMSGTVLVELTGGKITRRVYGGCYNEYADYKWKSSYYVSGTINLKIASGVEISLNAVNPSGTKYEDLSIYACSRYSSVRSNEKCTITFMDATAYSTYSGKLGASDTTMKLLMMLVNSSVNSTRKYYTLVQDY